MVTKQGTRLLLCLSFLTSLICISPLWGQAQRTRKITGLVVENSHQTPLASVNILVSGSGQGTLTDDKGMFSLQAAPGDTLEFSYTGYSSQRIPVSGQSFIRVVLNETSGNLGEVVVTALGIKRQTRSLGYATQQIDGATINAVKDPGANIINTLNGKVAGAVITPAGSGPGSAVRIVLRGNRSINGNNNALIVVDGIPIDNTMSTEAGGGGSANTVATQMKSISSGYSGADGASSVNPEDVESITVLKGPAAAALYGSRAANGALIITTKSGKSGKTIVNYDGGASVDQPFLLTKFQNTYGRGNGGQYGAQAGQSWGAPAQTFPDNVRSFYRTGYSLNNSVSISGGSDKLKGYASYTNNSNGGILRKNDLDRNTLNLRLSAQVLPKLTADVKVTYMDQSISHLPRLGDQGVNNEAYIMPRDLSGDSLKQYENFNAITGQPYPVYWTTSSTYQNPYWDVNRMPLNEDRSRVMINGSAKYQIAPWLYLQGRYSLDSYNDKITGSYYDGTIPFPVSVGGRYQESYISHWERNMDVLLSGNNKLSGDLNLSYNLGASVLTSKGNNTMALADGLSVPNQFNLNFASSPAFTNTPFSKEIQSVYANAQLDFRHYLYLDASARNDWSSTLPSPYSYFYPSVGLSAVISDMVKMPDWISFGKVRGSFTQVGNDADPYQLMQVYYYDQGAGNGFISRDNTKSINNLKPEKTKSWELGLDWKFLNNRIALDATYYKSNTINQLIPIELPLASGFDYQYINVGNIENKGFELLLTVTPVRSGDFTWTSTVNFATNKNKVLSLRPDVKQTSLSPATNFGQLLIVPGGSYGDIYGYGWAKDPKTGQHLVSDNGLPVATDNQDQKLGNFNPDFTAGWGNNFQYKNFSLFFQIDGRVGGIIVSGTDAMLSSFGVSDYTAKFRDGGLVLPGVHTDGSTNTTAITSEQLWTTVSNGGRSSGYDEFFAYHATNFRLRELSLGYDFNIREGLIKGARISLTGRNLFFLYRGKSLLDLPGIGRRTLPVDPETAIGTSNYQGVESGLPPATRSFGINLHLTF